LSESYVQLPVDSAGKKLRTVQRTVGANTVHDEVVEVADANGNVTSPVERASAPAIYNIAIANANTEYGQILPSGTKRFSVHTRDGSSFRLAFETGKVAAPTEPYLTIPSNSTYYEDSIKAESLTVYFACSSADKVVEIVTWT